MRLPTSSSSSSSSSALHLQQLICNLVHLAHPHPLTHSERLCRFTPPPLSTRHTLDRHVCLVRLSRSVKVGCCCRGRDGGDGGWMQETVKADGEEGSDAPQQVEEDKTLREGVECERFGLLVLLLGCPKLSTRRVHRPRRACRRRRRRRLILRQRVVLLVEACQVRDADQHVVHGNLQHLREPADHLTQAVHQHHHHLTLLLAGTHAHAAVHSSHAAVHAATHAPVHASTHAAIPAPVHAAAHPTVSAHARPVDVAVAGEVAGGGAGSVQRAGDACAGGGSGAGDACGAIGDGCCAAVACRGGRLAFGVDLPRLRGRGHCGGAAPSMKYRYCSF
eukprot:Rhum_TRINITY_DN2542_c0_g1::Rhum_TRINITY_DN2542_c0_g1_i1::g.7364::m.7364